MRKESALAMASVTTPSSFPSRLGPRAHLSSLLLLFFRWRHIWQLVVLFFSATCVHRPSFHSSLCGVANGDKVLLQKIEEETKVSCGWLSGIPITTDCNGFPAFRNLGTWLDNTSLRLAAQPFSIFITCNQVLFFWSLIPSTSTSRPLSCSDFH